MAQTVHGFYTERSHECPYTAGNYLSKIETGAEVTAPIPGGGTYRITTDTDTELLLLGGLGYRYRLEFE